MEWTRGAYLVTTDPTRLDRAAVHRFLQDAYWASDRPADVIDRSLDHSITFALLHDGAQVGMARVVTDRATFAWLCDVYIEAAHRGDGLGQWLMEVVLGHPELTGLRRWLLSTSYSHSLYARVGFTELPDPSKWMIKLQEPSSG